MAIPDYADTGLPHSPLVDSWNMPTMYLDPIQTDMEGGNKRLRTQPGSDVQRINFDVLMSLTQFNTFKTFVVTTLNRGSSRFTMLVWMGAGFESHTVQFAAAPTPRPAPPKVKVSFDLWVY